MSRLFLSLLLILTAGCATTKPQHADLIVENARIFTADAERPWAEAIAVRGDRILAVGSSAEIAAMARTATRRIDAGGRVVVPGFNDAHYHTSYGPEQIPVQLQSMDPSFADVENGLRAAAAKAEPGQWITATIGPSVLFDSRANRNTLDAISPNNPVMVMVWSGHGTIFNSPALQILNIDSHSNGRVHEYAEFAARRKFHGLASREEALRYISDAAAQAVRFGITSIQEMSTSTTAEKAAELVSAAGVPVRWRVIRFPIGDELPGGPFGTKWILDGTPVERFALMRDSYQDRPNWVGQLNFPPSDIPRLLHSSAATGQQVLVHAVGDRAADILLDAMDATGSATFWRSRRLRIEHGDFLHPDQHQRTRDLGVVVVQNPSHLMIPEIMHSRYARSVVARSQQNKTLIAARIPLAFGSDGPINPFLNILFATTHAVNPDEAITREQAVIAYTRGSAYAEFAEKEKGTLREGMLADFAVLSADIFTIPPPQLPAVESVLTVIGGRIAHDTLQD